MTARTAYSAHPADFAAGTSLSGIARTVVLFFARLSAAVKVARAVENRYAPDEQDLKLLGMTNLQLRW